MSEILRNTVAIRLGWKATATDGVATAESGGRRGGGSEGAFDGSRGDPGTLDGSRGDLGPTGGTDDEGPVS